MKIFSNSVIIDILRLKNYQPIFDNTTLIYITISILRIKAYLRLNIHLWLFVFSEMK